MPIYEYECQVCQKITETRQSITDAPLSTCPTCGGEVSKIISQTSFQLKGGGWYADGYGSTSAKACPTAPECAAATPECAAATPPCKDKTACGSA